MHKIIAVFALMATSLSLGHALSGPAQDGSQPAAPNPAKIVGAVKSLTGSTITLTSDAGAEVTVIVAETTRMLRVAPGQNLKSAASIQLQDIQAGDRILVRGTASADAKSIQASSLILMKQEDIADLQARERADWQQHGVGGLVTAVDPAAGTVTISNVAAGQKNILIRLSKDTKVLRYAPNSVKFDDARPGSLDQIRAGDQLRARGARSADGSEISAVEIVSGSFRNVAGRITSLDPAQNTIVVMDLLTKKSVTVKIGTDSQVRKLPPMVAQRMAMRLKGSPSETGTAPRAAESHAAPSGPRPGGAPDLQQILNRMPTATIADMQKGDAVMIVSTQGSVPSEVTAITLLTGVEPILTASGGAATVLSPWSLGQSLSDAMGQ
jgi:hypothetical protein